MQSALGIMPYWAPRNFLIQAEKFPQDAIEPCELPNLGELKQELIQSKQFPGESIIFIMLNTLSKPTQSSIIFMNIKFKWHAKDHLQLKKRKLFLGVDRKVQRPNEKCPISQVRSDKIFRKLSIPSAKRNS